VQKENGHIGLLEIIGVAALRSNNYTRGT